MSILYVTEHGATISIDSNCIKVQQKEDGFRKIPIETLESINIFGKSQMTTQCMEICLRKGIPVSFYSENGSYFGKLQSTGHITVERQRRQAKLYDTPFALKLGKRILGVKVKNQEVILRRYERNQDTEVKEEIRMLRIAEDKKSE